MISGEKILITGASGEIGRKLGKFLAQENEVWALARYAAQMPEAKEKALAAATGAHMRPIAIDLGAPDFSELPQDFTYVLHLAHTRRGPAEFIESIDINAVGAGLLLQHCRKAKAALVMSSTAVYSPPAVPFEALSERSDIGRAFAPWAPSSPVSKVSLEAVARFCAEAFGLPVAVMRLNTVYGPEMNVMPVLNMDAVVRGDPVRVFADPYPHSPIHIDDMCDQLEALLAAASSKPANIVNWCGDEVVLQRGWCDMVGRWCGKPVDMVVNPIPGTRNGNACDPGRRTSITGPCTRPFEPSFRAIYDQRHGAHRG